MPTDLGTTTIESKTMIKWTMFVKTSICVLFVMLIYNMPVCFFIRHQLFQGQVDYSRTRFPLLLRSDWPPVQRERTRHWRPNTSLRGSTGPGFGSACEQEISSLTNPKGIKKKSNQSGSQTIKPKSPILTVDPRNKKNTNGSKKWFRLQQTFAEKNSKQHRREIPRRRGMMPPCPTC